MGNNATVLALDVFIQTIW